MEFTDDETTGQIAQHETVIQMEPLEVILDRQRALAKEISSELDQQANLIDSGEEDTDDLLFYIRGNAPRVDYKQQSIFSFSLSLFHVLCRANYCHCIAGFNFCRYSCSGKV